jgi:hypothetical protein
MPQKTRTRAILPDRNFQLPHPDLVTDTPTPLERTQQDIAAFKHHWEQLGLQAQRLAQDLQDLEAAGGVPPDISAAIQRAINLCVLPDSEGYAHEERGVGGRGGGGCGEVIHNHNQKMDTSTPGGYKGGADPLEEELVRKLFALHICNARLLVRRYGCQIVQESLDQLHARPSGSVANPGAYLCGILRKYSIPAAPAPADNRYVRGKYGHLVKQ